MGRAYDARRGAVLASHPPQFLAFSEGHLQPAVTTGNGAFDRDSCRHFPNITTANQGGDFGHACRAAGLICFCPQGHSSRPLGGRVWQVDPHRTGCKCPQLVAERVAGKPSCNAFGRMRYFRYSSQR